jgi:hypothetical protein
MRVVVHDNLKKGQVDAVRENSGNHYLYFVNRGMLDKLSLSFKEVMRRTRIYSTHKKDKAKSNSLIPTRLVFITFPYWVRKRKEREDETEFRVRNLLRTSRKGYRRLSEHMGTVSVDTPTGVKLIKPSNTACLTKVKYLKYCCRNSFLLLKLEC